MREQGGPLFAMMANLERGKMVFGVTNNEGYWLYVTDFTTLSAKTVIWFYHIALSSKVTTF